ncbi:conserved Plasmodium protein, unknown function [Plasmodium vivax]|nr:conserved Plasmodium protein, unknown function [Plasmodium vivax]
MHVAKLLILFWSFFAHGRIRCVCRLMRDCRLFLSPAGGSESSLCGSRAKRGPPSRGSHGRGAQLSGGQSRGDPSKGRLNRVTTPKFGGVPVKRSPNEIYLFGGLKNVFGLLNWFGSGENEKFCEDVIAHLGDITKMKQLTRSHTSRSVMEGETMKRIFRHVLTSPISYRVLNCVSYLIRRYKVDRSKLCTLLNELSDEVKEMRDAENFLALHTFFLEDQSVALFSLMHVIDFFRSKRRLMEAQDSIRKKIYEQCVNDLIRKKVIKYKLFCERRGIPFLLGDALDKIRLSEKEEDVYFSYDREELSRVFIKRVSTERGRGLGGAELGESWGEGGPGGLSGHPAVEQVAEQADEHVAGRTADHTAGSTANHTADAASDADAQAEENENLMELKKTYQEMQSFNDSIVKYIESNQRLFYFDENEPQVRRRGGGEAERETPLEASTEASAEEDMEAVRKRIDSYIHEHTKSNNMTMEQFANEFVQQADLNFKAFLKGLRLGGADAGVAAGGVTAGGVMESGVTSDGVTSDGDVANGGNATPAGAPRQNQLTTFKLKKLNEGDADDSGFHLTNEILYERLRVKMLYFLQKMEHLKFKYQHEIINERYPVEKNEKTVLDVLKFGYKIVVSPDVDNSLFQQNRHVHGGPSASGCADGVERDPHEGEAALRRRKHIYDFKCRECDYHIFSTGENQLAEEVAACPQCHARS